jgi:hypothetical protein
MNSVRTKKWLNCCRPVRKLSENSKVMVRIESSLEPPVARDGVSLADWAEILVFAEQRTRLSRASLRSKLSEAGPADEAVIASLQAEVRRRASLAPASYPFKVDDTGMVVNSEIEPLLYQSLLLMAHSEGLFRQEKRWGAISRLLEGIAKMAFISYLGPRAEGRRFGWPSVEGRPEPFSGAITWLADELNLPEGSGERNPVKKDGGVDVVAWIPFADTKHCFALVLGQVTVALHYRDKGQDIPYWQWQNWITFGTPPMTALVVPFALSVSDPAWNDLRYNVSILLDRLRICQLLRSPDLEGLPERGEIEEFVTSELGSLVL